MRNSVLFIFVSLAFLLSSNSIANVASAQARDLVNIVCNGTVAELKEALKAERKEKYVEGEIVDEKGFALYSAILLKKVDMVQVLLDNGVSPNTFPIYKDELEEDIRNIDSVKLFKIVREVAKRNEEDGTEGDCASGDRNAFFYSIDSPRMLEVILRSNRDYCTLVNACGESISNIIVNSGRKKEEMRALMKAYRAVCR